MLRRRHSTQRGTLDFTSLVDIALVLVVFFLLSAQVAGMRSLPVVLPQAGTGEAPQMTAVELVINRAGVISNNGLPLELRDLAGLVTKGQRFTILADGQVAHGRVIEVVDALRHAGAHEIYYATSPKVEDW